MNKTEDPNVLNKAWEILVKTAHAKKVITYSELGDQIGVGSPKGQHGQGRGVGHIAGEIGKKCNEQKVPCLNALCVDKNTGRCGSGLVDPNASGGPEHVPTLPEDLERGVIWTWPGIYDAIEKPFS
ncbi:MAG: hypothetical protein LBR16_01715 [Treponema sp.]|jgi:hypothetical protein|nr:hypothetical protein [Treponema sp.]